MYLGSVQAVQLPIGRPDEWYGAYDVPYQHPYAHGLPLPSDISQQYEHNYPPNVDSPPALPSQHQTVEYNAPLQRDADEPDPSSRPRLTTEQTNILEAKFQQDPKPPTNTKKDLAQKIGLTLDKVNNWYQNRRAKAKNARKNVETFGVLQIGEAQNNWQFPDYQSAPNFVHPPQHPLSVSQASLSGSGEHLPHASSQSSLDSSSTFKDSLHFEGMQQSGLPHDAASHPMSLMSNVALDQPMTTEEQVQRTYEAMASRYPSFWNSHDNSIEKEMSDFEVLNLIHKLDKDTENSNGIQIPHDSQPVVRSCATLAEVYQPSPVLASWSNNQNSLMAWVTAQQDPNSFEDNQVILQQSSVPILQPRGEIQQLSDGMGSHPPNPIAQRFEDPSPVSLVTMASMDEEVMKQSPNLSVFNLSSLDTLPERSISRRGSGSSDLADDFDTIHLQKVQSQQTSDEEVFKTPEIPQLSLAARRKRRPVALGPISNRTVSCTSPPGTSPIIKTAILGQATSVRRIKSTGNSLNVIGGRIQKSGVASAQRSPLNFATFQEAEAMNHINRVAASSPSNSQANSVNGHIPMTPHTPPAVGHLTLDWNKPLMHSSSNPNMIQFQQHPSSPKEEYVHSPPATPYLHLPAYINHSQQHLVAPPQSAPAHLASFPHLSPPYHAMPGTPSSYFPPQGVPSEPYQYQAAPQMVPVHGYPVYEYQPQTQPPMYGYEQPHIINYSPPLGGHPMFYAMQPPQPQKELEVVMAEFPKPMEANSPPKEPFRPKQFTFQNSGPGDYYQAI
ncbi:hypothetical protein MMC11_004340 [Xylographa trunciseda]|nr:hypothetical protein [Xylographa trunciseda]